MLCSMALVMSGRLALYCDVQLYTISTSRLAEIAAQDVHVSSPSSSMDELLVFNQRSGTERPPLTPSTHPPSLVVFCC